MVKRRSKKQPKFTIREVDVNEFNRLQKNAKAMIRSRKKKYNVDISGEIDLRTSVTEFKTRKEFNAWKESMNKLRYRADLQIKKTKDGTVATQKQINQSVLEAKINIRKLTPVEGKKGLYKNKYGATFTAKQVETMTLQTNVARDLEIKRKEYIESIPRYDRKGRLITPTKKDKTEGSVIVREKFDPSTIQSNVTVKMREENLKHVSDPQRYEKRSSQLKENNIKALREMLGDDVDDIVKYFEGMSNSEFNNFFFMYSKSSMGFDYIYQSGEYSLSEGDLDDRLEGVAESIRTDINRYDKIRKKYKLMEKY